MHLFPRLRVFLFGLCILSAANATAQSPSEIERLSFFDHFLAVSAISPAEEGSEEEARLLSYLTEQLAPLVTSLEEQPLDTLDSAHSFSTNLIARIEGSGADELIIAASLNGPAENLAILLELASRVAADPPEMDVSFAFFGANQAAAPNARLGSRVYLDGIAPEGQTALLYLGLDDLDSPTLVQTGGAGTVMPRWLLTSVFEAFAAHGRPVLMPVAAHQVYRLAIIDRRSLVSEFLAADLPSAGFVSQAAAIGGGEPTSPDSVVTALAALVREYARGLPAQWDRHYLYGIFEDDILVIGERVYVLILLSVLALAFAYPLMARRRFRRYRRSIMRNWWNIPLLLVLAFAVSFVSGLVVELFFRFRNAPSLWEFLPSVSILLKVLIALVLLAFLYRTVRRLALARKGSFFSAAALLFLFVDVIVLAAINVSLSYYFLWAFVCAFFFSVLSNRLLKVGALLLSPLWIVFSGFRLLGLPALNVVERLLFSSVGGNLLIAVVLLPFIFMLVRTDFFIRHPVRGREGFILTIAVLAFSISAAGLSTYLFVYDPYSAENPQPLSVTETIDHDAGTHTLAVETSFPIEEAGLAFGEQLLELPEGIRRYSRSLNEVPDVLVPEISARRFLGRREVSLSLAPELSPEQYTLSLSSTRPFEVNDSNFPFTARADGRRVEFHIGRNPPVPLEVSITLPQAANPSIRIITEYEMLTRSLRAPGPEYTLVSRLVERRTIGIPGDE